MEQLSPNNVDYGEILYEKSNAKTQLDTPTGKIGAKGWAQRIYMLLLSAGLLAWFVYSLVHMASQEEVSLLEAIVAHVMPFFVLAVAELILMLSAFGGWGKFARKMLRHRELTNQRGINGAETRQLQAELNAADANLACENAVRIYRDYVVVVNDGQATEIPVSNLQRVTCEPASAGYKLTFHLYDNTQVVANMLLPAADVPLVKKHFYNFEHTTPPRDKGYLKKKLPMVAFMLVPVLVGVALLMLHFFVFDDMPILFGVAFMAFGVILMIAQFDDVAIIKHGVMPILFGVLLIGLPIGIALTIADMVESISIATIMTRFTEIHAVLSVFMGLGPMLIIMGIAGIVDCARL